MAITAMLIFQIIVVLFVLFAWSRAVLRLRDHKISRGEFAFWTFIWAAVVASMLLPQTAERIAHFFGISRPIDLAVYVSILLLFYLIFRMYVQQEQVAQDMTKLVRKIAMRNPKKK